MRITKSANAPEGVTTADIVQRLEEEIALGVPRPRERLVEDDLMARFRTKRHVVRVLVERAAMDVMPLPPDPQVLPILPDLHDRHTKATPDGRPQDLLRHN